jgi:hypothetical protein
VVFRQLPSFPHRQRLNLHQHQYQQRLRLKFATKRLNVWNAQAFAQLVSSGGGKETNVTESGIIATAQKVFQQLVKRDFVPALCGTSNFKPDVEGKTLVVIAKDAG